jgi:hypothetical protein
MWLEVRHRVRIHDPSEPPIGSGLTTKITIRLPRFLHYFPGNGHCVA